MKNISLTLLQKLNQNKELAKLPLSIEHLNNIIYQLSNQLYISLVVENPPIIPLTLMEILPTLSPIIKKHITDYNKITPTPIPLSIKELHHIHNIEKSINTLP